MSIVRKSGQVVLRTSDRSWAASQEIGDEGKMASLSEREFKLVAADRFHLLIGGSYAGLVAVGVARLRRGSFELCFWERGVLPPE